MQCGGGGFDDQTPFHQEGRFVFAQLQIYTILDLFLIVLSLLSSILDHSDISYVCIQYSYVKNIYMYIFLM